MCDITPLIRFNVFGTSAGDDNFTVNQTCDEVKDSFSQYCLIPPTSRLQSTTTCSSFLLDPLRADYIFPQIVSGHVKTLDDLPVLYSSFEQNDLKQMWIRNNTVYNGFKNVPNIVTRAAVSDIAAQKFLVITLNDNNVLQLFSLDSYGLFRSQSSTMAPLTTDPSDQYQNIFINDEGTQIYVILQQVLYKQYIINNNNSWDIVPNVGDNVIDVMFNFDPSFDYMVVVSRRALTFVHPASLPPLFFSGQLIWACMTQDKQFIIACEWFSTFSSFLHIVSISNGLIFATFNLGLQQSTIVGYSTICLTDTWNGVLQLSILLTNPNVDESVVSIIVIPGNINAIFNPISSITIRRFVNHFAWIQNNEVFFASGNPDRVLIQDGMTVNSVLALPSSGEDVWSFTNVDANTSLLWRLHERALPWTNDSKVYMAYRAQLSDTVDPWIFTDIAEPWYYGTIFFDVPLADLVFDGTYVLATSRHNRFRWILDRLVTSPNHFPYILSHTERINDYWILSTQVAFFTENANLFVPSLQWETNTRDQSSDPTQTQQWLFDDNNRPLETNKLATANGLYILYVRPQTDQYKRRMIIVYNAFNSPQFANWCKQDSEYIARAIGAQRDFCNQNLRRLTLSEPPSTNNASVFLDPRCSCIGGKALFDELFPAFASPDNNDNGDSSLIDQKTNGQLIAFMPCVLTECGQSFLQGPENSNSYYYVSNQCKQDLTMCSDNVSIGGKAAFGSVNINQNCGRDPNGCLTNAECPIGSICFNGRCVLRCSLNAGCQAALNDPFAICDQQKGLCLFSSSSSNNGTEDNNNNTNTNNQIVWIIIAILVTIIFVFIIVMLAIFVDDKKTNPNDNKSY